LQGGQDAHVAKNRHVAGQQGFADVKAGEDLLFENEDAFAGAPQKSGGAASAGSATNYQGIVDRVCHREGISAKGGGMASRKRRGAA